MSLAKISKDFAADPPVRPKPDEYPWKGILQAIDFLMGVNTSLILAYLSRADEGHENHLKCTKKCDGLVLRKEYCVVWCFSRMFSDTCRVCSGKEFSPDNITLRE